MLARVLAAGFLEGPLRICGRPSSVAAATKNGREKSDVFLRAAGGGTCRATCSSVALSDNGFADAWWLGIKHRGVCDSGTLSSVRLGLRKTVESGRSHRSTRTSQEVFVKAPYVQRLSYPSSSSRVANECAQQAFHDSAHRRRLTLDFLTLPK